MQSLCGVKGERSSKGLGDEGRRLGEHGRSTCGRQSPV